MRFLLLLIPIILCGCHTTKSTATSSESAQNSVEQVQRRSAQKCSSDSIWRFTALSIDSLTLVFEGGDKSATHEYELPACPESNGFIANKQKASAVTLYGIHLSHEEKENAVAEAQVSDSNAQSVQSSHDNAQSNAKRQSPISNSFLSITNSLSSLLILLIMATAIILYIRNKLRK